MRFGFGKNKRKPVVNLKENLGTGEIAPTVDIDLFSSVLPKYMPLLEGLIENQGALEVKIDHSVDLERIANRLDQVKWALDEFANHNYHNDRIITAKEIYLRLSANLSDSLVRPLKEELTDMVVQMDSFNSPEEFSIVNNDNSNQSVSFFDLEQYALSYISNGEFSERSEIRKIHDLLISNSSSSAKKSYAFRIKEICALKLRDKVDYTYVRFNDFEKDYLKDVVISGLKKDLKNGYLGYFSSYEDKSIKAKVDNFINDCEYVLNKIENR